MNGQSTDFYSLWINFAQKHVYTLTPTQSKQNNEKKLRLNFTCVKTKCENC